VFDPSSSSTFGRVGCNSDACHALAPRISCDARSNCQYQQVYGDGSNTNGLLSTETFTFDHPNLQVPKVYFGCSTSTNGYFVVDAYVGLGPGANSLVAQLGADTSLGRRFSYCLPPYTMKNASSALNFGARAAVTEPGAVTTPLLRSNYHVYYTIELESVRIGNATFEHLSRVIIDSGTSVTFLDKALLNPMVKELTQRIGLPTVQSPEKLLQLCYDVSRSVNRLTFKRNVPNVTLQLAVFGVAVTLKAENTFVEVRDGIMCLAIAPVTQKRPVAILGNIAQQNMHVGYDLDKGTVTFAPADCARSYNPPPVHG
jgi:hypothetical protein